MRSESAAIVVLGMHRSGTSPLTRVLTELGAASPSALLGPHQDNPDGYFESPEIVALDNKLLEIAGLRSPDNDPIHKREFDQSGRAKRPVAHDADAPVGRRSAASSGRRKARAWVA